MVSMVNLFMHLFSLSGTHSSTFKVGINMKLNRKSQDKEDSNIKIRCMRGCMSQITKGTNTQKPYTF